jgi:hypothetical protein
MAQTIYRDSISPHTVFKNIILIKWVVINLKLITLAIDERENENADTKLFKKST